jgi:predicted ATP-dependent protease
MSERTSQVLPLSFEQASFEFDPALIKRLRNQRLTDRIVGQPRALRSLEMGLSLPKAGYNIFVSGESQSGRHAAVRHAIEQVQDDLSGLRDIVYVCNFTQPDSPHVLTFAPGEGSRFIDSLEQFNHSITLLSEESETFPSNAHSLVDSLIAQFPQKELERYFFGLKGDIIRQDAHIRRLGKADEALATRYLGNLVVDHSRSTKRPMIIESHPSMGNLFGTIHAKDKPAHLSYHPGSLLESCGGFIIIDAAELFSKEGLWEALKRYLDATNLAQKGGNAVKGELANSIIRPQIPPLSVKVILIGSEELYDALSEKDDRFLSLFKVNAQFDYTMNLTEETIGQTIANIDRAVYEKNLLPITDDGMAQMLRYSAWFVESRLHLSTQFPILYDLLDEANFWAKRERKEMIDRSMILKVNEERSYASGIYQEKINEQIKNGEVIISLQGAKVGVVNGLAVIDQGAYSFGTPTVISATVAPGTEGIVNIEHEAGLSGEIHDKGLLILEGYLRKHYARSFPLSIYAGIAFEQSYAEVDGDSASSSELFALLSAIGELEVRQDIAVTGSVNQMGEIQPVGGINEKIEGFFHTCRFLGLTGKQGVIIPYQNVSNLILSYEILQAIRDRIFFIYPIRTIEEGMRILTGRPSGVRNAKGNWSAGNFNYDIENRLKRMYQAGLSGRN